MIQVVQTDAFAHWLNSLADIKAVARIGARIRRLELGNPGDVKSVGEGVSEMRIDYGPGYRVYFTRRGKTIVLLLCGGDKRTQSKDVKAAQKMVKEI
ncbi:MULTISPECIES: type II toxin-antitoxin system RelE/ParE family toxin [unclassified Bradyrhizobium]|uniref:type II toxin-antitoxin system RelE/ParE family toxin n=1 Tax=unclassified Bradyrhizobium TaxID=2631580 RepID=UPI00209EA947|nr:MULTISPECIES: type II toxin-antitoxin system RelE/ParE family toxin [unclassified Bradyrhizobium]MCP1831883.1 putative addiction module killer protein [Bradyrhizobium sp. USDA 4545]MCP1914706.1 putative addiction module killer protein [Bradyrhizobium elkanii]MCP1916719.1 putative addiction module killer protein [Bradyrhizobium sp. USDA 4532]